MIKLVENKNIEKSLCRNVDAKSFLPFSESKTDKTQKEQLEKLLVNVKQIHEHLRSRVLTVLRHNEVVLIPPPAISRKRQHVY